jgi:hypothetical protein
MFLILSSMSSRCSFDHEICHYKLEKKLPKMKIHCGCYITKFSLYSVLIYIIKKDKIVPHLLVIFR